MGILCLKPYFSFLSGACLTCHACSQMLSSEVPGTIECGTHQKHTHSNKTTSNSLPRKGPSGLYMAPQLAAIGDQTPADGNQQ